MAVPRVERVLRRGVGAAAADAVCFFCVVAMAVFFSGAIARLRAILMCIDDRDRVWCTVEREEERKCGDM